MLEFFSAKNSKLGKTNYALMEKTNHIGEILKKINTWVLDLEKKIPELQNTVEPEIKINQQENKTYEIVSQFKNNNTSNINLSNTGISFSELSSDE